MNYFDYSHYEWSAAHGDTIGVKENHERIDGEDYAENNSTSVESSETSAEEDKCYKECKTTEDCHVHDSDEKDCEHAVCHKYVGLCGPYTWI